MTGRCVVILCLEDANSGQDDVSWKIRDEKYVAVHETVFRDELLKVGTRKCGHLPASAIEVGGDRVLVS